MILENWVIEIEIRTAENSLQFCNLFLTDITSVTKITTTTNPVEDHHNFCDGEPTAANLLQNLRSPFIGSKSVAK
jgi:hypothetical protein